MKDIQVKEVMIPISNYVTVKKASSLIEVIQALEMARKSENERAHRDAIVVNENGSFIGKVTMMDIFRALEPNFKKIAPEKTKGVLTRKFVMDAVRDFNLWLEPMENICQRGEKMRVADVMHAPEEVEYIKESDTLEKALAEFVMGVHQPLIVKKGDEVTGVLRFGDLFEIVRNRLLSAV
jgi:CBS domain containing-hemolysin-like protein